MKWKYFKAAIDERFLETIYSEDMEETKAFIKKYLDKYQKEFDEL